MDSFVMAVGAIVLVGMVFMLIQVAGVINQAPRPHDDPKEGQGQSDEDKSGLAG